MFFDDLTFRHLEFLVDTVGAFANALGDFPVGGGIDIALIQPKGPQCLNKMVVIYFLFEEDVHGFIPQNRCKNPSLFFSISHNRLMLALIIVQHREKRTQRLGLGWVTNNQMSGSEPGIEKMW
ncbi:MAG: hypothetical protein HPY30_02900 [Gammaproteobacteria bacterium (ex Lamellibrachia satsuma)]|nr:MAG: hypothetical protein HPY30_02900 [Gammaproteobacteria bacterium (ex Lamellibrachia satsuma)]